MNRAPATPSQRIVTLKAASRAAGLASAVVGGLVLVGWALDTPTIKSLLPGLATMKANTALGFVAAGIALSFLSREPSPHPAHASPPSLSPPGEPAAWPPGPGHLARMAARAFAAFVALLGLLTLTEYALSRDLGIDQLLFKDAGSTAAPGRMSPAVALNFLLLGLALSLGYTRHLFWLVQALSVVGLLISSVILLGYLYDVSALYSFGPFSSVALHTAFTFLLVSLGILCARPERGLVRVVVDEDLGGIAARRLLPYVAGVPVILGGLLLYGERAGLYQGEFGVSALVISSVFLLAIVVWWNARQLSQIERNFTETLVRKVKELEDEVAERQSVETALSGSEKRFRMLIEHGADAIVLVDAQGTVMYAAPTITDILGYSVDEYVGRNGFELIHPDDVQRVLDLFSAVLEGPGKSVTAQVRERHHDGSWRWLEGVATNWLDEPCVSAVVVNFRDITERKQAEDELRQQRSIHELLLQTMSDLEHGVIVANADARFIYANDAMARMYGYTVDELMAMPSAWGLLPADVLPRLQAQFRRRMLGEPVPEHFEIPAIRKDGRRIELEIAVKLLPSSSESQVILIARDITERKQAEAQLAYQAHLLAHVNDAILATDAGYHLTAWNAAAEAMYGWAAEEVLGRSAVEMLETRYADGDAEAMRGMIVSSGSWRGEVTQRRKDGSRFQVEVASIVLHDPDGQIAGYVAVNRDISERKRSEEQLRISAEILQRVNSLIVVADSQGQITYVSPYVQPLLGYAPEELLGDQWWVLTRADPTERAVEKDYVARAARGEAPILEAPYERMVVGRDGQPHWIVWQDAKGPGQLLIGVGLDITARRQAEEMVRHSADELARLYRATSPLLSSGDDLVSLAVEIAQTITQDFDLADCGVLLTDPAQKELRRIARTGNYDVATAPTLSLTGIGLTVSAFHAGEIVYAPDVRADPRYVQGDPRTRSELVVPLQISGSVIGLLDLQSPELAAFDERARRVVAAYAEHAALALQNARLRDVTRQRLDELEALNKISTALRATQTLDDMLSQLLNETVAMLHARAGSIWLYDPSQDQLRLTVQHGWGEDPPPVRRGQGLAGHVLVTGEPYISHDLRRDPRTADDVRERIPEGTAGVCVPVRAAAEMIGAMIVQTRGPHELDAGEIHLLTALAEIAGNAIHRTRLHARTERQLHRLTALRAVDQAITSSFDIHLTLSILLDQVTTQLQVDATALLLSNPHSHILEYAAGRGFRSRAIERSRMRVGEGQAGRAALERRLIHIPDLSRPGTEFKRLEMVDEEGFRTYCVTPVIAKGMVRGVLEVFHRSPLPIDAEWLDFLETMAGQAALAIDSAQLFEGLQRSNVELMMAYDSTLEGWSRALDLRDRETEGHTQRVTDLTVQLARQMGIGSDEMVHVRRGALLHDIGKMGIPDSILFKPAPLSVEEWDIMRRHPAYAHEMLAPIAFLRRALDIPYCHHEKWDGTGYPRGLKGDQIPLVARIFTVVDVWDALRSDRPYRKAWPENIVRQYIRDQSGRHFDPNAAETFLRMVPAD